MKVLFVDDNQNVLSAFRRNLRKRFDLTTAEDGPSALKLLEEDSSFGVIVSDMKMPGMDGIQFLEQSIDLAPDCVRIMLTGNADQDTAVQAVNRGHVFRFLNKPCSVEMLTVALEEASNEYKELELENKLLEETVSGCVRMLSDVLGMVAPYALGRGQKLRDSISPFAKVLKLKGVWVYEVSALLSSVGCTALPSSIVRKLERGESITAKERKLVRKVPQTGFELINRVARLDKIARIVRYQKKNFDGGGFPEDDISGASIPLGSRILKVFEERMELEREGVAGQAALQEMKSREGYYDPKVLDLCFRYYPDYLSTTIAKDKQVFSLDIDELKSGYTVVSDIVTSHGFLLVEQGSRLTHATIQRMSNYVMIDELEGPFFVQKPEDPSSN